MAGSRLSGRSAAGRDSFLRPGSPWALGHDGSVLSRRSDARLKPQVRQLALYLLAFSAFAILYVYFVSPSWAYMGFVTDVAPIKLGVAVVVLAAFSLITPPELSVRGLLLNVLLTVYLIPSLVIYSCADKPTASAAVMWGGVATVYIVSSVRVPPLRLLNVSPGEIMWALAITTIGVIGAFYVLGGFRYFNLDLSRVYDYRVEATEALPGLFGYVASAMSKVVIPFGLAASLFYKERRFTIFFVVASVVFFGLTSNRSVLFAPIVFWGVFTFVKNYKTSGILLIAYVSILFLGGIDSHLAANGSSMSFTGWFESLFVRRALLLPSLMDFNYIEFFSENAKYYWSESRLTFGLSSNPYGYPPPRVIGEVYFGNVATNANAGFIGSGFAQAGLIGTLCYSVGAGLIVAICQAYGQILGRGLVAAAMMGQYAAMVTSTDFLTLFLTHGLLLALLLLAVMRPPAATP